MEQWPVRRRRPAESLFTRRREAQPLAARMRPAHARRVRRPGASARAGQAAARGDRARGPGSMIFWGPPGSGKTTLAHLVASSTDREFVPFSAVTEGVPRIREIVGEAASGSIRWPADHPVRRRDPPAQQGAAGQPSPARRRRHHHAHRRHDRESQLRDQRRAAVAHPGVRPPAAHAGAHRALVRRALGDTERGSGTSARRWIPTR